MSEFGKGLSYCLALFLCHSERDIFSGEKGKKYEKEMDERMREGINNENYSSSKELWFNGSSDHLYDLQIPKELSIKLKKRLKEFQSKVIHWGHGFGHDVTKEDKTWAIQEAKNLIREIDKFYGIKVEQGDWE